MLKASRCWQLTPASAFHCTMTGGLMQTGVRLKSTTPVDRQVESERVIFTGGNGCSAGDLNSLSSSVWRGAIHLFLLPIRFCGSQSPSRLFPLGCAIGWFNTMTTGQRRQASQSRTGVVSTAPVDHAPCAEENDQSSRRRPACDLPLSSGLATAGPVGRSNQGGLVG